MRWILVGIIRSTLGEGLINANHDLNANRVPFVTFDRLAVMTNEGAPAGCGGAGRQGGLAGRQAMSWTVLVPMLAAVGPVACSAARCGASAPSLPTITSAPRSAR